MIPVFSSTGSFGACCTCCAEAIAGTSKMVSRMDARIFFMGMMFWGERKITQ
jgi:hypothetical protein